jgi:hypothetical protein
MVICGGSMNAVTVVRPSGFHGRQALLPASSRAPPGTDTASSSEWRHEKLEDSMDCSPCCLLLLVIWMHPRMALATLPGMNTGRVLNHAKARFETTSSGALKPLNRAGFGS